MPLTVKICGVRRPADAAAACDAGADALGFVFAESPRRVSPSLAAGIIADLPQGIVPVAVFRRPTLPQVREVLGVIGPVLVQLDRSAPACSRLGRDRRLAVVRDGEPCGPGEAAALGVVLYEPAESGRGRRADWCRAAALAQQVRLVLAGGLDAGNVGQAVSTVGPWGVDVSSGVEHRPGVKDPARIREFVAACREAEPGGTPCPP